MKNRVFTIELNKYKSFVKENFPTSIFNHSNKIDEVFYQVNCSFILSDILTEYGFVEESEGIYNLLLEYKRFTARFLSTLLLNDKYLLDNLLRLLTERLYRIVVGTHFSVRGENRLRKDSRADMANDLNDKIASVNKDKLDQAYRNYSNKIHLTNKDKVHQYDIAKLFNTKQQLDEYVLNNLKELNEIFIEEIFKPQCNNKGHLITTAVKARINNNFCEREADTLIMEIE